MDKKFVVTEKAQRPASMNGKCFYCGVEIGNYHKDDCVLVSKNVKIRMIIEYEIDVPASWDKEQIEFHRNMGTWCADNIVDEFDRLDGCLCNYAKTEYIGQESEPYLDEG